MTSRDKSFRLKLYPSLGYIVVLIFTIFVQRGKSMEELARELPGSNSYLWLIYLPMFTVSGSIGFMSFYDQYQASWLFRATPVKTPGLILSGAVKANFIKYFVPLYLVMFMLAFPVWGLAVADDFLFGFFNTLASYFVLAAVSKKSIPFTLHPNVEQQSGRFLAAMLHFILIAVMVGVHYLMLNQPFLYFILLAIFIIVYWGMVRFLQGLGWNKIKI